MDYKDYNDNELLMYIGESDEEANEIMYKKYYPIIRDFVLKIYDKAKVEGLEFNDLIQEGMLGLNMAITHYDTMEKTSFYTFASTCIKRKIISSIVQASGKKNLFLNRSISFDYDDDEKYKSDYILIDNSNIPEDIVLDQIYSEDILEKLNKKLSNFEKSILSLKIKGFKYKEISKYLNKNYKTIDNAIQRIRMKLKNVLAEMN